MKIVLLGYMASGKSTIGRFLAGEKKLKFIDLDAYIEVKEKQKIAKIFEQKGEIYFRKQEAFYLSEVLSSSDSFVLSLGGGTPCYGSNLSIIKEFSTHSIYLNTKLETLIQRLTKEQATRPLIAKIPKEKISEFIAKHLFERTPFYKQAAQQIVTNDFKTPIEIAKEISRQLQ